MFSLPKKKKQNKKKKRTFTIDDEINDIKKSKKTYTPSNQQIIIPVTVNSIDFGEQQKEKAEKSERATRLKSSILKLQVSLKQKRDLVK